MYYDTKYYTRGKWSSDIVEIPLKPYTPLDKIDGGFEPYFCTEQVQNLEQTVTADDPLLAKSGRAKDRLDLVLSMVRQQEASTHRNLASLYADLFTLHKGQSERPYPDNYARDVLWLKLTEDKLKLYGEIRRVIADHQASVQRMHRDIAEAVLDYRKTSQQKWLLGEGDGYL